MSENSNAETLLAYENNLQAFLDNTPKTVSGDVQNWLEWSVGGKDMTSSILELGSGPGRDADYIESLGYTVQRSDAADSFIKSMEERGHSVQRINALTDEISGPYDLILANCVFLHFTPAEFSTVLDKLSGSLSPGGTLAFSLKRGEGSEWSSKKVNAPRFFQYWTQDSLKELLNSHGYTINKIWDGSIAEKDKIYVICSKP